MPSNETAEKPPSLFNIPNALSAFRLVGSVVLVGLAVAESRSGFIWLLGGLLVSDWIDGKLAIAWRQQTVFGARLDSAADAAMYAAMLFGVLWLRGDLVKREWPWFAAGIISYAITSGAGLMKYGRIPSYHTRAAKTSWLLVSLAAFSVFVFDRAWPLRVAAGFVVLTNLEATAMTCVLKQWTPDLPSLWHALKKDEGGRMKAEGD